MFVIAAILGQIAFGLEGTLAVVAIFLAVTVFGGAYGALPTLGTTIFLHAGRDHPDTASSIYVVTYQVGIASGAALGAMAVDADWLLALCGSWLDCHWLPRWSWRCGPARY